MRETKSAKIKPTSINGAITLIIWLFSRAREPKFQKEMACTPGLLEIEIITPAIAVKVAEIAIPVMRNPKPFCGARK